MIAKITMTIEIEEVIKEEELLIMLGEDVEIMEIIKIKKVVKIMISLKAQLSQEIIQEIIEGAMIVVVIMLIQTNGSKKTHRRK